MTHFRAATILLSTVLACASASAATLNFETLGSVEWKPAFLGIDGAFIQGASTNLFTIANDPQLQLLPGAGGAICSAFRPDDDTLSCAADMQITFKTAVSNLSLQTFGYDPGDSVTISAYAGNSLLNSQIAAGDKVVDFSTLSGVTKLVFDDQSSASGFAFGKFSFTSLTSPVPEPATGMLMLLGVAALGQFARQRRAS